MYSPCTWLIIFIVACIAIGLICWLIRRYRRFNAAKKLVRIKRNQQDLILQRRESERNPTIEDQNVDMMWTEMGEKVDQYVLENALKPRWYDDGSFEGTDWWLSHVSQHMSKWAPMTALPTEHIMTKPEWETFHRAYTLPVLTWAEKNNQNGGRAFDNMADRASTKLCEEWGGRDCTIASRKGLIGSILGLS
jgi:uncharacterized protein YneF (UPF0154 family)